MSELPMRGHFRYLRFKTFPMTPRTPQCKVFFPLLSSSKHSGVLEDSQSQLFQVLGFTPTLGQSRGATLMMAKSILLLNKFSIFCKVYPTTLATYTLIVLFSKMLRFFKKKFVSNNNNL